jgi:hypothetical protein
MNIKLLTLLMAADLKGTVADYGSVPIYSFVNSIDCSEARERVQTYSRLRKQGIRTNEALVSQLQFFSEKTCFFDPSAEFKVMDLTRFQCKTEPCEETDEDYQKAVLLAVK